MNNCPKNSSKETFNRSKFITSLTMKDLNSTKLLHHARRFVRQTSTKGMYIVLLLYYAYSGDNVPSWAKKIIIGSIAYFVSPIDSIPDLTPFIGMTDDLGVLTFGLVTIACYITDDTRVKAKEKLSGFLKGDINNKALREVDSWL